MNEFQILALSLILSRSLGILSYSDALSDELQKTLVEQLKVASQIRPSTAEDGEKTGYSLGQDSLYVRWALDSLAEPSGKHDSQRPLYEGIATLFFIVDPPVRPLCQCRSCDLGSDQGDIYRSKLILSKGLRSFNHPTHQPTNRRALFHRSMYSIV